MDATDLCHDSMAATFRDDCFRHCAHGDGYCDYRSMIVNADIAQYAHDKVCEIRDKQWMAIAFSPDWFSEQFARTGKSQAELFHFLSGRLGLDRSQVNKSILGKRKVQPPEMPLVWEFFGLDPADMATAMSARHLPGSTPAPQPSPNATRPEFQPFAPAPRIPVFGHAAAGDDGRFIMNGQRIADTFCPPVLSGVEGAYAVYVHGESMEPRFRAGETVWINPHQPVRQGDDVVAQILDADEDDGSPPSAYVKRFVSRGSELVLHQFNPPDGETYELRFPEQRVVSVHRIVFAGIG
ncbi:S24 family peptidase [Camelimonas lactis]|nr:S24 family peptidase [Camelimonas lactis]